MSEKLFEFEILLELFFWDDIYFDGGEDDEIYDDGNENDDYLYFPLKKNIEIICF